MAPFKSEEQRKFMFAKHPDVAKKWAHHAKMAGQPVVKGDIQEAAKRRLKK